MLSLERSVHVGGRYIGQKAEQSVLHSVAGISATLHCLRVGSQYLFLLHGVLGETEGQWYIHSETIRRE